MAALSFRDVKKSYAGLEVIHGVTTEVADGEFVVIVGPSGCGKSTLLRMVAGLEPITAGEIRIGDRVVNDLEPKDRDIAMVFQNYALYPHMSVYENMSYGLRIKGFSREEIESRVQKAAAILELGEFLKRKPRQLSGGQRQRVAMGRAIVREPAVFLFDEPLSNLDAKLRAQMRIEIKQLQQRLGTTGIFVTHDQVEAMTLGDRIVVLADGHIQQIGRPIDIYRAPANRFVAGFIGTPRMNFVEGRVQREGGRLVFVSNGARIGLPPNRSAPPGEAEPTTLGVRPEDLVLDSERPADNTLTGRVVLVERLGGTTHVHFDVGSHRLMAAVTRDSVPDVGEDITVHIRAERVHLFDAGGRSYQ